MRYHNRIEATYNNIMETKYRTLLQAALMIAVIAVLVFNHSNNKAEQAVAQQTTHLHR